MCFLGLPLAPLAGAAAAVLRQRLRFAFGAALEIPERYLTFAVGHVGAVRGLDRPKTGRPVGVFDGGVFVLGHGLFWLVCVGDIVACYVKHVYIGTSYVHRVGIILSYADTASSLDVIPP